MCFYLFNQPRAKVFFLTCHSKPNYILLINEIGTAIRKLCKLKQF